MVHRKRLIKKYNIYIKKNINKKIFYFIYFYKIISFNLSFINFNLLKNNLFFCDDLKFIKDSFFFKLVQKDLKYNFFSFFKKNKKIKKKKIYLKNWIKFKKKINEKN